MASSTAPLALVRLAADIGADAVKFQWTSSPDRSMGADPTHSSDISSTHLNQEHLVRRPVDSSTLRETESTQKA